MSPQVASRGDVDDNGEYFIPNSSKLGRRWLNRLISQAIRKVASSHYEISKTQRHWVYRRRFPPVTIHHFPLDGNRTTFYSLPIFDALAIRAIPVAVPKRTLRAATFSPPQLIQYSQTFGPFNPATTDGGQLTT